MREVLVIGAAGKTGRAVARALLERGVSVRAAVRPGGYLPYAAELASPVPRTPAQAASSSSGPAVHRPTLTPGDTRATGVDHPSSGPTVHRPTPQPGDTRATRVVAVAVDMVTGLGLDEAMAGVDAVYHLAPNMHPDEVGIAARVVASAAAQGVPRFVFHSVLHPDDASMPHHVRKAEAEKVIRARLSGATVLRPAAYGQNLLDAALSGRITVPYSIDVPFTNVDLLDVAQVAAQVLTEAGHEGATYDLAGPERLSVREQAGIATEVIGRPVEGAEIDPAEWAAGAGAGLSERERNDLLAMFRAYDREGLVGESAMLRRLLGREPQSWQQVLERAVHAGS